jgi:hypothetical protein
MYRNCKAKLAGVVGVTLLALGGAGAMSGCVSGSVKQLELSKELSSELPAELRDQFEYHGSEAGSADRALASSSFSGKSKKGKRKKSKGKGDSTLAQADAAPKIPFTYPARRPAQEPIWQSERLTYGISYLGLGAGELTLEVLPFKTMANRKVYHVRGNAVSSAVFSLFYQLNDVVETFIDYEGMFSHRFHLVLNETKQQRDSLELYDSEKQQTYYWDRATRKNQSPSETKKYSPIQAFSQDSVSALYYLRTIPLTVGSVVTVPIVSEGNTWDAVCTVVRREIVGSPMGDIPALVLKPEMKYQGILRKNGDSYLWLTDDDRRIPLRLEAKVRIGYVIANLNRVELGTPPTALAQSPSTK